ncbi:MAG: nucleotide exchange factor GrpE [Pyrinomonadaceae bacterium]
MRTEKQIDLLDLADKNKSAADNAQSLESGKDETKELQKELETEREQYLRLAAEFDNYRRRTNQERKGFAEEGKRMLLEQFVTIADDFDLALNNLDDDPSQISEAMIVIERRFQNMLKNNGVSTFESLGETFDPEIHEAFDVISATENHRTGTIHSVVRRGYFLNDKLLRPAIVVVAQ